MVDVDVPGATVVVGSERDLLDARLSVTGMTWTAGPVPHGTPVRVQCSAHGASQPAEWRSDGSTAGIVVWDEPQRRIAPGQSVVLYDLTESRVLGGGTALRAVAG